MLEAVEKNKVKHQIGFNYRFAPIQLAKQLIEQGKLEGDLSFQGFVPAGLDH